MVNDVDPEASRAHAERQGILSFHAMNQGKRWPGSQECEGPREERAKRGVETRPWKWTEEPKGFDLRRIEAA